MSLPLTADPPPLTTGDDGVVRVAGTRVTLDTVVEAFRAGSRYLLITPLPGQSGGAPAGGPADCGGRRG